MPLLSRTLLTLAIAAALLAPAAPVDAWCPCPGWRHAAVRVRHVAYRVAPHGMHRATRRALRSHRHSRRGYRYGRRRTHPRAVPHIRQEQGAGPVFLGDLYITSNNTPLWARPGNSQVLARLPKRTIVTNMGRVAVTSASGRVVAYYYKVEAPNGKVGYVSVRYLSQSPPEW